MTNLELQNLTQKLSTEKFNRPFIHDVYFNQRLRTTGGRYHLNNHHIDINPKMIDQFDMDNLVGVILHELCHYHLHLTGKDYHHGSHDFKALLQQVGGSRYAPIPATEQAKMVRYQCQSCWNVVVRRRKLNVKRHVCARCGGRLKLI